MQVPAFWVCHLLSHTISKAVQHHSNAIDVALLFNGRSFVCVVLSHSKCYTMPLTQLFCRYAVHPS